MSRNATAEAYVRITRLRERERTEVLGRAQADLMRARERVQEAESQRHDEMQLTRDRFQKEPVSAAALSLFSDALVASQGALVDAQQSAEQLTSPVDDAREALTLSAHERLIAEKWLDRRVQKERARLQKAMQKSDDEITTSRAAAKISDEQRQHDNAR